MIVEVLGTPVGVRGPAGLMAELDELLTDLRLPADATRPVQELVLEPEPGGTLRLIDAGAVVRAGIPAVVGAATVVWHLNAIAARSPRHLVVHAGTVGGAGAVLLPGRSGTGKSTLVAACVAAGMTYLSDELAVVALDRGDLVPYAKPLGLEGERLVPASRLRAGAVGARLPPAAIVFPSRRAHTSPEITPLDPGWTLTALAAHTTNLGLIGGAALPWLAALATSVPAWQATYGEAHEVAPAVRDAASATARPLVAVPPLDPVTPTTTTVVVGDGLAVFDSVAGRLHLLDPAAAFVWACIPDTAGRADLVDLVLAREGGPRDRAQVGETMRQLVRAGLLAPG